MSVLENCSIFEDTKIIKNKIYVCIGNNKFTNYDNYQKILAKEIKKSFREYFKINPKEKTKEIQEFIKINIPKYIEKYGIPKNIKKLQKNGYPTPNELMTWIHEDYDISHKSKI
jgi:hypothetical protein